MVTTVVFLIFVDDKRYTMKNNMESWHPDDSQQRVIEAGSGYHLVLAPPGCGKTQILTERIRHAHSEGVDYADMLCLTFTNRAARGMAERIAENIDEGDIDTLFVGNIHRFCSRMLYSEAIIPAETAIINDDDIVSIMSSIMSDDELTALGDRNRRRGYMLAKQTAGLMYQIINNHPKEIRMHPECLTTDDITAVRLICKKENRQFTPQLLIDIYTDADQWRDICRTDKYEMSAQKIIMPMLTKMYLAHRYKQYKEQRMLVDFEDLLLRSYDALREDESLPRYGWIQIDEVQDLNPLQMAIADLLIQQPDDCHGEPSVMYLGDEQQAIFAFMGAKGDTLTRLRKRCEGNIHYLEKNHRSPDYLLNLLNAYAENILHIDNTLLPQPTYMTERHGDELGMLTKETEQQEIMAIASLVEKLQREHPEDTTAVIVTSNNDAERISNELNKNDLAHFKISGNDIFDTTQMQLLISHLTVMTSETNLIAWARLLKGLRVFETGTAARNFVTASLRHAIMPSDYILRPGTSYAAEFLHSVDNDEVVVFDTETTGTSTFDDDIVQIAAVKMRNGKKVEGSEFSVFIMTDREVPAMIGDEPNPIIEALKHNILLSPREALSKFIKYASHHTLIAHNADFDYNILNSCLQRHMPTASIEELFPRCYDTLRMARLLHPELKQHKLRHLLAVLGLEGSNTHMADDDVDATVSLIAHLCERTRAAMEGQRKFLDEKRVQTRAELLHRNYSKLYNHSRAILYHRPEHTGGEPAIVSEMRYIYRRLLDDGTIQRLDGIERVMKFIATDIIGDTISNTTTTTQQQENNRGISLVEQIDSHIMEINTLKEADLAGGISSDDKVYVTTVHKAKGLEFDNVIVFDAVDGRYPSAYNRGNAAQNSEDARKLYVAMSRARQRLVVAISSVFVDRNGYPHERKPSPFLEPIMSMLESI